MTTTGKASMPARRKKETAEEEEGREGISS
jgi:hypothetical protein